ncbi:MAG TPA: transporter [Aliidongia sp.]|nr:transporter [Aliidongia sp.]
MADPTTNGDWLSTYFDQWFTRVDAAQASQPHWMTPLATVTPRLEEEFRYDQFWQHLGTGASIDNIDGGKGLELIPTETNEILINLPPYEERNVKSQASGWGDWAFLTVKQRLLSANEENGNYIVTAFLGLQAPTGAAAFTNDAWVVTPTLAAGKGWGDFDIQATVGAQLPLSHESTIGNAVVSNLAFQYHVGEHFWPELEFNDTYWSGGLRDGKNQVFLTPGVILGRFPLGERAKGSIGVGYQIALSPTLTKNPALTPTFDHAWIVSARVGF